MFITFGYLLIQAFRGKKAKIRSTVFCALVDTFGWAWVINKIFNIITMVI